MGASGTTATPRTTGNGSSVDLSADVSVGAGASVSSGFNLEVTIPDDATQDPTVIGDVSFNTSNHAGSGSNQSVDLQVQESSGSTADEDDQYEFLAYNTGSGGGTNSNFLFDSFVPFGTDIAAASATSTPTALPPREATLDLAVGAGDSSTNHKSIGYGLLARPPGDQIQDYHRISYNTSPVSSFSNRFNLGPDADGRPAINFTATHSVGEESSTTEVWGGKMWGSVGADPNNLLTILSDPLDSYEYKYENINSSSRSLTDDANTTISIGLGGVSITDWASVTDTATTGDSAWTQEHAVFSDGRDVTTSFRIANLYTSSTTTRDGGPTTGFTSVNIQMDNGGMPGEPAHVDRTFTTDIVTGATSMTGTPLPPAAPIPPAPAPTSWYNPFNPTPGTYLYYLMNPSRMDDGLETGFKVLLTTATVAGGAAAAVAAAPAIAAFGASQSVVSVPTGFGWILTSNGTLVWGATSTATITVTGSQALGAAALMGAPLFMRIGDDGVFHDSGEPFSNFEANQLADQHRELKRSLQEMLDEMSEFSPLRPGIEDALAEVVRDLGSIIRYIASLGR
ncbi:MAG: hypothetical protein R3C49_00560 [Planctomycetaceae bacterium]